jgi:hypothetical protein
MSDNSAQMLQVLAEMRDLLRLIAEPAIAQRDKKLREALRGIAGSATGKKAKAVLLMDGTRTQIGISNACGINKGDLSVLVKKLKTADLLVGDPKQPQLTISVPPNFFEQGRASDE